MDGKGKQVIDTVMNYVVLVELSSEHIVVWKTEDAYGLFDLRTGQTVKGIADFVQKAKQLAFGWGQFQDHGDEVIYLYDKGDENFGYAVNLDDPQCSEWGYA